MKKLKNTLFGGFLITSLAFTGYSHTLASQRFTSVDTELAQARQELQASSDSVKSLEIQVEVLEKKLAEEKAGRLNGEKKLKALSLELNKKHVQLARTQELQAETQRSFQDLEGEYAAETVSRLLKAGVIELGDGKFRPNEPISRGEFLQWLVKATNTVNPRTTQVRPATTGDSKFTDVTPDSPYFPFVQGATNSGFVIGYDETTFRPERNLSREEMIAIKVSFDKAKPQMNGNCGPRYTDFEQISPKYKQAVHNCDNSNYGSQTASHIWGSFKTFYPQKEVTRAEAALCVERIKAKYGYKSVGQK